jgi:hypothetical protein
MTNQSPFQSFENLMDAIRELETPIRTLIEQFDAALITAEGHESSPGKRSGAYWVLVAYRDSLVRSKIFLEQNFHYIEPMGLLAVVRYLFELMVWLKLLERDHRYGLVYYRELLINQLDYYEQLHNQLRLEVDFLKQIDVQEKQLMQERLSKAEQLRDPHEQEKAFRRLSGDVKQEVDARAARAFSLYFDQARFNGYSFQAHLVESKVLPDVLERIDQIKEEKQCFESELSPAILTLCQKKWNWQTQAGVVQMAADYNFIYRFTSKLLHAIPCSITTDQMNLEQDEVKMFLKNIHVRLLDMIEMAQQVLRSSVRH